MTAVLARPGTLRVAFQGERGAFGDAAVAQRWGTHARAVPARTFEDALLLVREGSVDHAVIPVWNSTIGDVREACEALVSSAGALAVVDEITVPVRHCLLALPGATLDSVRAVGSHPAALAQCGRFLAANAQMTPVVAYDTAGAARQLARLGLHGATPDEPETPWFRGAPPETPEALAVIASAAAALQYGLRVLAGDVQDDAGNRTRFVVVRAAEARRW